MTYSLAGRCARTGMLGTIVTTSSIAVGNRCQFARSGVGAVLREQKQKHRARAFCSYGACIAARCQSEAQSCAVQNEVL